MSDALVENHGSISQIICESDAAKEWIEEHCSTEGWQ